MKTFQKKLLFLLFFISQTTTKPPQLPDLGIELTMPLSSLVYILEGGELASVQENISKAGGWGHNPYWFPKAPQGQHKYALPMTHGYLATTNSIDFVLQPAVNTKQGFKQNNGSYSSPFFYFSDVQRTYRNCTATNCWWMKNIITPHSSRWSSKAPTSAHDRGASSHGGTSFDQALNWCLYAAAGDTGMQHLKYYGLVNSKGITISADTSFPVLFFYHTDYYFAQTGVKYFLPIHLVSPQDDIRMADPDFLNHGPVVNDYNTPIPGTILPWSHGYMPANIPALLTKQQTFVTDTNNPNKIDF